MIKLRGGGEGRVGLRVEQELCIPFYKKGRESKKPFVGFMQTKSKTASCLPASNVVTMESYYMCVFEDFKMEINIFPKSAVIIKMRICLTVRNPELKNFLFLKLNADESYTVQNRNIFPPQHKHLKFELQLAGPVFLYYTEKTVNIHIGQG